MQNNIVLRRGRCGRMFAKYVQKSIFEDNDSLNGGNASDAENDDNKTTLRKRRKRYQDLFEYLYKDYNQGYNGGLSSESIYQGLLMRD